MRVEIRRLGLASLAALGLGGCAEPGPAPLVGAVVGS